MVRVRVRRTLTLTLTLSLTLTKVSAGKCAGAMGPTIMKGIFANWLVCLAEPLALALPRRASSPNPEP